MYVKLFCNNNLIQFINFKHFKYLIFEISKY